MNLDAFTWLAPDAVLTERGLQPLGVCIAGDRIVALGSPPPDAERLPGQVLLPGFVNAHSHAFQRALRGFVQHRGDTDDSFWTWREAMYAHATTLDPEGVERITELAFREMLSAGFTTVGEFHYLHHQPDGRPYPNPDELSLRIAAVAQRVGIRLVLLYVAYARAGFGVPANPRQARFLHASPDDVLRAIERIRARGLHVGLAPHSMRACPADWLRAFAGFDGVIHAHVDEQPGEVQASLAEHGCRPLEVFARAGLLGPRFSAVHLTHPDAAEIALLAEAGGHVVACPTTELDLGDGLLPAAALDVAGVPIAIGTDSHASIDPLGETRLVEWHARALAGRRNVLRAESGPDGLALRLLSLLTVNGARSLGVDAGVIAPGKLADFVAIDLGRTEFMEARPLPSIVFNGSPAAVSGVWVGGKRLR